MQQLSKKKARLVKYSFQFETKNKQHTMQSDRLTRSQYWIKGGKWAREKLAGANKNTEIVEPERLQRINLDSCGEQLLENNLDTKGHRRFVQPEKKQRRNRATVSRF